jgi:hypothetical protein
LIKELALKYKQMYRPTLEDKEKRVLRVIRQRGVAPGWQVMSEASVNAQELSDAASKLMDIGLIRSSSGSNPKEIEQAYFNILPSNSQLAEAILSS